MQVVSSQRAASPVCFPATVVSHLPYSPEVFSSSGKGTNLTSSKIFPSRSGHSLGRRFSGLRLEVEENSERCPAFVNSGSRRHDVRGSRFNVFVVEDGEQQEEKKDDREEVKLKIPVGPIRNRLDETFTFKRVLGPSSVLVMVTLRKPLGIIFEAARRRNKERVVVADLVPGSHAQRALRVNQMFQGTDSNRKTRGGGVILNGDVRPGDVLRASTTVGVVVDLFGIRAPQRVMMLHVADGRCWDDTMAALKASFVADGPLTLVLEREI